MSALPCFLCGDQLQQRTSKRDKPYFVCDPCGMQIFIRRKHGIENLQRLMRTLRGRDLHIAEHAATLFEIRAILEEMEGVQGELKKIGGVASFFSDNKEKMRARKLLKRRVQTLLDDLEHIAEQSAVK